MTTRANTEIFRCVIEEGFGRGNLDALDDCFPPTYIEHQYGHPSSLEGFKQVIVSLRRAVPDLKHTIDELIETDGKVWARMTARGTHRGSLMGFAPTGRSFAISVLDVCRFEGGKIVEHWGVPDRFAMLQRLGLLPAPPSRSDNAAPQLPRGTHRAAIPSALEAIHQYYEAFSTLDESAFTAHFCEPTLTIAKQGVLSAANRTALADSLAPLVHSLRAKAFGKSEFVDPHVTTLGETDALVRGVAVRYTSAGAELDRIAISYLMHRNEAGWKIAALVVEN